MRVGTRILQLVPYHATNLILNLGNTGFDTTVQSYDHDVFIARRGRHELLPKKNIHFYIIYSTLWTSKLSLVGEFQPSGPTAYE